MNEMAEELREDNIMCPYCKTEEHDSWEYSDDSNDKHECDNCGKYFSWSRNTSVDYTSTPNCELNNEEHEFSEYSEVRENYDKDGFYIFRKCIKCNDYDFIDTDEEGNKIKELKGEKE
jgi:hypothetical protein